MTRLLEIINTLMDGDSAGQFSSILSDKSISSQLVTFSNDGTRPRTHAIHLFVVHIGNVYHVCDVLTLKW